MVIFATNIFAQDFDAFVSYHHQDDEWVRQELRPRLEDADPHFRLCLHQRDFVAGATVIDNICAAVAISRRMVLLLSRAFLQSHWCQAEFREAHYKVNEAKLYLASIFPNVNVNHIHSLAFYEAPDCFSIT